MVGEIQVDLAIRPAVPISGSTKAPRSIGVSAPTTVSPTPKGGVAIAINTKNHHNHFNVHANQYHHHHHHHHHHQNNNNNNNHDQEAEQQQLRRHKHKLSSYSSEGSPLSQSRNNSLTFNRPAKRQMATPDQTIAVINASGRQTASLIRYCTAVGFKVRAQLRNREGVIATEVCSNPNVTVLVGELYTRQPSASRADVSAEGPLSGIGVNEELIRELFSGCQLAFINTTFYGDEVAIGKALADEALAAGISHFIYSSMPDHAAYDPSWPSLPLYRSKHQVEAYIRSLEGLEATFVYAGIYNNNFTSLPYPLFGMELQEDGSFLWQAPFHPEAKLPWVDCEHDFGTAILSIFKEGPKRWGGGRRVPIAFEMLTPREACRKFSSGVGRPVRYVRGPIEVKVKIPEGYRTQLDMVQRLYSVGGDDALRQPPYFGDLELETQCPDVALELWGGPRSLEEYAREEFIIEEQANGLRWMMVGDKGGHHNHHNNRYDEGAGKEVTQPPEDEEDCASEDEEDDYDDDDDDEGLVMRGPKRLEEKWLA